MAENVKVVMFSNKSNYTGDKRWNGDCDSCLGMNICTDCCKEWHVCIMEPVRGWTDSGYVDHVYVPTWEMKTEDEFEARSMFQEICSELK